MAAAMAAGGFKTKREAVEEGLRLLKRRKAYAAIRAARGTLFWDDSDEAWAKRRACLFAVSASIWRKHGCLKANHWSLLLNIAAMLRSPPFRGHFYNRPVNTPATGQAFRKEYSFNQLGAPKTAKLISARTCFITPTDNDKTGGVAR